MIHREVEKDLMSSDSLRMINNSITLRKFPTSAELSLESYTWDPLNQFQIFIVLHKGVFCLWFMDFDGQGDSE